MLSGKRHSPGESLSKGLLVNDKGSFQLGLEPVCLMLAAPDALQSDGKRCADAPQPGERSLHAPLASVRVTELCNQ